MIRSDIIGVKITITHLHDVIISAVIKLDGKKLNKPDLESIEVKVVKQLIKTHCIKNKLVFNLTRLSYGSVRFNDIQQE